MKILKILLIFITIIIVIPIITIFSIYGLSISNEKSPFTNEIYTTNQNFTVGNFLEKELINLVKHPQKKLEATLTQETLNAIVTNLLVKTIKDSNKKYNPDDKQNDFIFETKQGDFNIKLRSFYFTFGDKSLTLNSSVRIENIPIIKSYNTTLRTTFTFKQIVESSQNKIQIQLSKIKLGNLPIVKSLYRKILEKLIELFFQTPENFKQEIEKRFKATSKSTTSALVDPKNFSITINLTKFVIDFAKEAIAEMELKNFFEQTLLNTKGKNLSILNILEEKKLGFSYNLKEFAFIEGEKYKPLKEYEASEDYVKKIIGQQLLLLSLSNTKAEDGSTSIYYTIDEEKINQIISYEFKKLENENKTSYNFKIGDKANFKFSVNSPYLKLLEPNKGEKASAKFYMSFDLTTSYDNPNNQKYSMYSEIDTVPVVIRKDSKSLLAFRLDDLSFVHILKDETITKTLLKEQKISLFEFLVNIIGGNFIKHNDGYYFLLTKENNEIENVIKAKQVYTKDKTLTIETQVIDEKVNNIIDKISISDDKKKELVDKIKEKFDDQPEEVKEAISSIADNITNKLDIEKLDQVLEENNLKEKFTKETYNEIIEFATNNSPENLEYIKKLLDSYGLGK